MPRFAGSSTSFSMSVTRVRYNCAAILRDFSMPDRVRQLARRLGMGAPPDLAQTPAGCSDNRASELARLAGAV